MKRKQLTAYRAIAILAMFAVAQVSLQIGLAQGPQFIARLTSTRGNQPILVNGISAASGASIVTGATIETSSDQTAVINLGEFGTLELAPNTQLRLEYDQNGNTKVTLLRGCVILRSKKKAEGEIVTEQGTAAKNDKEKDGVADVCFINGQTIANQNAAASAIAGVSAVAGGSGLSGAAVAAIVGAVGGGVLIAVFVAKDDNDRINPSPSTP